MNFDHQKVRFNRYKTRKSIDDDENDLFAEEKDDLTMLGTDRKALSHSSTTPAQRSTPTAISVSKKTDMYNVLFLCSLLLFVIFCLLA